jgi:8-oxo-dGTP diphosphatase
MDIISVVCGLIFNQGKILICRRNPSKLLAGYWEFPGGKVEANETEEASLYRELLEELGMKVKVGKHFKSVIHPYETFTIELIAYRCIFEEASYQLTDHDEYKWIDPKDVLNWKLAPADIPIAEALIFEERELL